LNRIIYQKVGWEIECKDTLTPTTLSLTEANLKDWNLNIDGSTVVSGVVSMVNQITHEVYGYNSGYHGLRDRNDTSNTVSTEQGAAAANTNMLANSEVVNVQLAIRLDLDDGTDWSALDIGKTITVDLYSTAFTVTNGTIREIAWTQIGNGKLYADLIIEA
jgi:hypothetical protein